MPTNFALENNNQFHRYLRLPIKEVTGLIIDSSVERLEVFSKMCSPKTKEDVIKMLGDQSGRRHPVFRENGTRDIIKTIAVGMLELTEIVIVLKKNAHPTVYFTTI